MESQRLLPASTEAAVSEESFEDDWTDRSSSTNSYSDSDDSTIPDWEPYVDDLLGELLYIDCHPFVTHNKDHNKGNKQPENFTKTQLRRSTRGKFLRLLRRRESKRYSKKGHRQVEEGGEVNTQKVKFQDFQEGEQKVVTLEIESENRYNLSGDKSLAESLLGLIVSTLSDGTRVMIAEHQHCYTPVYKKTMRMKRVQLTKYLKWIMIFTGSWRLKISNNKLSQISYDIYSVIFQLSLLCFFLGLIFNLPVLLKNKDFQLVAENVGYTIITMVMVAKLVICQTQKVRELLIQCITEEQRTYLEETEILQANFDLHVKHLNKIYYILLPLTTILVIVFFISNYIVYAEYKNFDATVNKPLSLPIWLPFDANIHYTAAFSICTWLTLVGTFYNVVTHVLFLTLMNYAALQLKALKIYGKYFHLYCETVHLNPNEYDEAKVLRVFRKICVKHQDIIRFVDDLNRAMRSVLFLEYLLNSLNIASVMIRILMMSNPPAMLTFCIVLMVHQILQLFWMSWHANEIELQSVSLVDALFQSRWYEQSEKVKRVLFIIMMRSRKPLRIFIGPFFPMSIRTGLATMKAAYSYVTLIFTLAEGFSFDSKAKHERNIKIGDWLKSINNIEVHVNNLDDILQKFINHDEVILTLQRVAATEVTKDPPINKLNLESAFVRDLLNSTNEDDQLIFQKLCSYPVGVVYINTDSLNENSEANEDLLYHFPRPYQKNVLCTSRGIFITLSHLIQDITNTKPRTSSMLYKGQLAHVVYIQLEKRLLMFMLPDDHISVKEAVLMSSELIRFFELSFDSLDKCFSYEPYVKQVDRLLFRYLARILCNSDWATASQYMEYQNNSERILSPSSCLFEEVMPVVPTLKLQDNAVVQIDDALSELEASDYREWNEDPLDCQRLFTILGSALFHSGYLLHSHLVYEDLADVYSFCKHRGLIHLSKTEPVRSLVLWKEVFPRSSKVSDGENCNNADARCYLLVVGSGKDFLAVIMEAGGATEPPEDNMGPDAFYVEEAQATLAHVQALGISLVAERCLLANGGFDIATPTPQLFKKKKEFIGSLGFTKPSTPQSHKESTSTPKKGEVISILKRRSSEQNVLNTSHEDSFDAYSEESGSQGYSERLSEISDESAGRNRKQRYDSNDEDSDLDDFGDGSQISSSSFDISEIRQSLHSELGESAPIQLTTGPHNVLYHFVHIDTTECVLVAPPNSNIQSGTYGLIINNFRRCCQNIHGVFQNTLRFKNMPAQDIGKSLMNKSLIAVKEYGMLFECPFIDEKESSKKNKISYWVIGRLFYMPHPKELYVCYQDTIPQNLVELAFKISLNSII